MLVEEIPDVCLYLVRGPPKILTVCFSRIPAARLLREQFRAGPCWELLKPEPSRASHLGGAALKTNPGAVLLKLGFGLSEDALDPDFSWPEEELLRKAKDRVPFCLRVFIYQAKELPASDQTSLLDPYVKVRFCGKKEKTRVHAMTTAPLFYETLEFHEMLPLDVRFGPDIVVQVWDRDVFSSNTPRALLRFPLTKCHVLASEGSKIPSPSWENLTSIGAEPISSQILMSAALIRKRDLSERLGRSECIIPQMRQAWVEITCVGVRQLKAHRLRAPQEPYVRIDVPAPNDRGNCFRTQPSSVPSGRNANFLERKVMAIDMPENPLYAPNLDLRVYDARVGISAGLHKHLLGASSIDLSSKLPWNSEAFVAPQTELFSGSDVWQQEKERNEESHLRTQSELLGSGLSQWTIKYPGDAGLQFRERLDSNHEDDYDEFECDVEHLELERHSPDALSSMPGDSGTGAFDPMILSGLPMIHEDVIFREKQIQFAEKFPLDEDITPFPEMINASSTSTEYSTLLGSQASYKLSELPISFPSQWAAAEYIEGREWWTKQGGRELENHLKTKPFETYKLFRGKFHPNASKSTLRCVGVFKGILRVLETNPSCEKEPFFPLQILSSAIYTVRLYIIRGSNLQPVNGNSADPYLRVKLGTDIQDSRSSHCTRTLKPEFYETFEFRTVIPGPSLLKVQVRDWNRFYPVHEIIGQTEIDLEDRWFHYGWQKLDRLKPIEIRSLHKDTSPIIQGQLHLWLEIRPEAEAHREPPVELHGPKKQKFELRIVCWKSRDVPFDMGDYFAEFWIGDSRKQKTDVHWRCRNGQASWNWRIKIPIELPLDSPEKGRLMLQLWDQDVIKWNEVIGDTQVDLYRWFLKAYHEQRVVNVFKEVKDAISRQQMKAAKKETYGRNIDSNEEGTEINETEVRTSPDTLEAGGSA